MNTLAEPTEGRPILGYLMKMHRSPYRWAIGAAAFIIAFIVRYVIHDGLPAGFPFLTFFPAVILTALVAGFVPGVIVACASTVASWYYFIAPHSFDLSPSTALALGFFVLIITVDLLVIHHMFKWLAELDRERHRSRELAVSRDLLFTEMQHRISNNLTLVGALLRMQQKSVTDDAALRALKEASDRVTLVGKIQRRLHDPDGQDVGLPQFLQEVTSDILQASGMKDQVECHVRGADVRVHPDQLAPVALVVAELVSNAFEHAFIGRSNNRLAIDVETDEGFMSVSVHDNGPGVSDVFDLSTVTSLGLKVANQLAKQQGGYIRVSNDDGARFQLILPLRKPEFANA